MCSIVASFDVEKIKELVELNRYRGEVTHSITTINPTSHGIISISRGFGPVEINEGMMPPGFYYIVHQQAPTGGNDLERIHPAEFDELFMWHNGILKQETIDRLAEKYPDHNNWDTALLLAHFFYNGAPEDVDGSFACLVIDYSFGDFWAFRNEISPLFYDEDLTFSSTKAEGLKPLPPNIVFSLDLTLKEMAPGAQFTTINNPYLFNKS